MSVTDGSCSAEHLQMRVPAVQEAIKRTRFAFFLSTLAAFAALICLWNAYLSTYRSAAGSPHPLVCTANCGEKQLHANTQAVLTDDELKAWVESQSISINLLGIRIGVSDFALLNSIAMYLLLYYNLLTTRRENREVGQLLRDIGPNIDSIGYAAYCAINSYMVFNLNRTDDNPISALSPEGVSREKIPLLRATFDIMLWTPALVIVFTIICDLLSLVLQAPFPFGSPYRDNGLNIWQSSTPFQRGFLVSMDILAALFAVLAARATLKIQAYEKATRSVLDEFSAELHTERLLPIEVSEA